MMIKKITYEKLKKEHLPFFYEIRFSVYENIVHTHQIRYLLREQALEDISQGGGWICKVDGVYAGMGFGIFIPEPIIGGLFIKPEYQSIGIGTELLHRVTEWFYQQGVKEIMLTTDEGSKAEFFYRKRGWVTVGNDETGLQKKLTKRLTCENL